MYASSVFFIVPDYNYIYYNYNFVVVLYVHTLHSAVVPYIHG